MSDITNAFLDAWNWFDCEREQDYFRARVDNLYKGLPIDTNDILNRTQKFWTFTSVIVDNAINYFLDSIREGYTTHNNRIAIVRSFIDYLRSIRSSQYITRDNFFYIHNTAFKLDLGIGSNQKLMYRCDMMKIPPKNQEEYAKFEVRALKYLDELMKDKDDYAIRMDILLKRLSAIKEANPYTSKK